MSLNESDLLRGLAEDDARQLLGLGTPRTLSKGEVVFGMGEEARILYLVEEGRVSLMLPMRLEGEEKDVSVEERTPGQILGWSALVPPYRFTLKAQAAADTELLAISREDLLAHFAARPDVGMAVMTNLAAIMGQRFQVFQTMWVRQMQRAVERGNA